MKRLLGKIAILFMTSAVAAIGEDEAFAEKKFTGDKGGELLYRWLTPARIDSAQRYPLVIFLHGAGERGNDNLAHLKHCVRKFAEPDIRKAYPSYVIAPQCPSGKVWVDVDWRAVTHVTPKQPSESMGLVLELVDSVMTKHPVDASRVYVIGLSMGGYGTWDIMVRRPDMVAAAVPICGGADDSQAARIAHIPVWVWHGDSDGAVKTLRSRNIVKALKAAGGAPIYSELQGVGHDSWTPAFKDEKLFPWLFKQRRREASNLP